ncbi:hypothetical protein G9A89_011553 [Geosiphon pyriformis]|nr:hypothetical protein G9A89_011553 [Geosiphon pyriformis]
MTSSDNVKDSKLEDIIKEKDRNLMSLLAEKKEDESPMINTPVWKQIYWTLFGIINLGLLVLSFALIRAFSSAKRRGNISVVAFYIIVFFESFPRAMNVYQLYQYTKKELSNGEVMAVILFKKEGYLLFGKKPITERQIDVLSYTSDLICVTYFVFMVWAVHENYEGLGNTGQSAKKIKSLTDALLVTAAVMMFRLFVDFLRKNFGKKNIVDNQQVDNSIIVQVPIPLEGSEPNPMVQFPDHVHYQQSSPITNPYISQNFNVQMPDPKYHYSYHHNPYQSTQTEFSYSHQSLNFQKPQQQPLSYIFPHFHQMIPAESFPPDYKYHSEKNLV